MARGRSIFCTVVYFTDLSTCAKFQGRSSMASYLPQGSLMKMPSEKYASGGILGLVYLDEWARYFRPAFYVRYYHISTRIVPSLACIADTVAKLRARQLGRNRHIKPSWKYASEAILGHTCILARKLDILELISVYNTAQLTLQSWQVLLAYLFSL